MKGIILCLTILCLACATSLLLGPATNLSQILGLLQNQEVFFEYWQQNFGLFELRFVHVLLAMGVGFALATGGRAMQLFLQNPLADPHIVGFSAGSTASVLLCYLFFPSFAAAYFFDFIPSLWLVAFAGALATVGIVQLIFWGLIRRWGVASLALVGLMVNAVVAALLMLVFARLSPTELGQVQAWTLGSIQPHRLQAVALILPLMVTASLIILRLDRALRLLSFGAEFAASQGINVSRVRRVLMLGLVVICSTTVCAAGSVGFVGLLVPHLSRRLFYADHFASHRPWLNAIIGALVLVVADLASRTLTAPLELPVGVYTALLALPFLMLVMVQQRTLE